VATAVLYGGAWLARRRSRAPLAVALFFGGTIFPTIGFINVYYFRYSFVADHFNYLSSLALLAAVAALLVSQADRLRVARSRVEWAAMAALGLTLATLTFQESHQFVNAETLYRTTIARNPSSFMAHNNLGVLLGRAPASRGVADEALSHLETAVRLNPVDADSRNNLGNALRNHGDLTGAVAQYQAAIRANPTSPQAHHNLGDTLQRLGDLQAAADEHQAVIRMDPKFAPSHVSLGMDLLLLGRPTDAHASFTEALRLSPDDADAHDGAGRALEAQGLLGDALREYEAAAQLESDSVPILDDFGHALLQAGRADAAILRLRQAVDLQPDYWLAHFHLANALAAQDRLHDAIEEYEAALRLADSADVENNLGVALMRLNRPTDAVPHFKHAVELNPDDASLRENLTRAVRAIK
jgi:tetratricopeptide (TPR) repeat protein